MQTGSKGLYVCRSHGGNTLAQRDPVLHVKAVLENKPTPKPPGGRIKSGLYSTVDKIRVDELVAQYRVSGLDPDKTEDNMLYLHAYIEDVKRAQPDVDRAAESLKEMDEWLNAFRNSHLKGEGGGMTVARALEEMGELESLKELMQSVSQTYLELMRFTKDMETRHRSLINMAKVRSETRLKNAAAGQLDVFTLMSQNFMTILSEQLPTEVYEALQQRMKRDMSEISSRALEPGTIQILPPVGNGG